MCITYIFHINRGIANWIFKTKRSCKRTDDIFFFNSDVYNFISGCYFLFFVLALNAFLALVQSFQQLASIFLHINGIFDFCSTRGKSDSIRTKFNIIMSSQQTYTNHRFTSWINEYKKQTKNHKTTNEWIRKDEKQNTTIVE